MRNPTAAVIGGSGTGKALHLAQLGVATRLHLLTDDAPVDRNVLRTAGVEVVTPRGPAELERELKDADLVVVGLSEHAQQVLPLVRDTAVRPWVDLHEWDGEPSELHDPFIEAATYVVLSDLELDNPLRTAEKLLPGKELVVLTHGKRGATAFFPDTEPLFVLPKGAAGVSDPDGSDDAFCAGTAYGRALGWDWPRSLHHGAALAGRSQSPGGPDLGGPDLGGPDLGGPDLGG